MLKCKCGGEFKNADPLFDSGLRNHGHVVWDQRRLYPGYATRRCNKCYKLRKQKLRVSRKAVSATQSAS